MPENLLSFVIIAILLYLGYLGKFYLPNYFKKKAENLAQIQDIEKLTTLVKEIEFKFEERTQLLKAKLDLTNQLQFELHNEGRNSLIDLHNKILEHLNFLSDVSLGGIDFKDNRAIQNCMDERWLQFKGIYVMRNKLMLFLDENEMEIHDKITEIGIEFLKFSKFFIDHCDNLKKLNMQNNAVLKTENNDSEIELYSNYTKAISEMVNDIVPKINDFTWLVKEYFKRQVL